MCRSCFVLLHISTASDSIKSGETTLEELAAGPLAATASAWGQTVFVVARHFIFTVQIALPLSFPSLLLATVNNLIQSSYSLGVNKAILELYQLHCAEGRGFDSTLSITHIVSHTFLSSHSSLY
jgi:hypothetical protein